MKPRYLAGISALVLVGALAALIFGGAAGAKSTGTGCPTLTKMTPTHGGVGTRVYFYGKNMDRVTSAWMRRKNDEQKDLFDAKMKDLRHGSGFVSAKVPADAFPRIIDSTIVPMEASSPMVVWTAGLVSWPVISFMRLARPIRRRR